MPSELVKEYAKNRMELKKVKDEISSLVTLSGTPGEWSEIDLSEFREAWLRYYAWQGWVVAVTNHDDREPTDDELKLANLLDKKAEIRRECGPIRLRVYGKGMSLLRADKGDDCENRGRDDER